MWRRASSSPQEQVVQNLPHRWERTCSHLKLRRSDMTGKMPRDMKSSSTLHGPDHVQAPENSPPTPKESLSPGGSPSGEANLPSMPFPEVTRYSLRQSQLTVPKPSYLRHGKVDVLTTNDELPTTGWEHVPEEGAAEPPSDDPETASRKRRKRIILRWSMY